MAEEVKKISFGFSKLVKKTAIVSSKLNQPKPDNNKVEFIDCLEGKSIKLKDPVECKDKPLVIPLKREIIDNTINKEIVHNSLETADSQLEIGGHITNSLVQTRTDNADCSRGDSVPTRVETLDEIAAREIIEDLNEKKDQEEARVFSVPLTSSAPTGEKESSLDDYENIPVSRFGEAMLRGMGWAPGKGIGKNEKLVTPSMPTLRPKGMGLGADKVIKTAVESGEAVDKDLKMTKGSYVRIIAGIHKDCYGQVEGFDEESCRMIVKLSLKNISVSLNEFMVQLVNKNEFIKNSKVINVGKYEKYKDDEGNREFKKQSNKNDKHKKAPSNLTEKELSEHIKKRSTDYEDKYVRRRSTSKSISPEVVDRRKNCSETSSRQQSDSYLKNDERRKGMKNAPPLRDSPSNSSDNSSSDYSSKKKHRTKRKKPSSHRYKSRTRSRSPRDHSSHKRHKKRK